VITNAADPRLRGGWFKGRHRPGATGRICASARRANPDSPMAHDRHRAGTEAIACEVTSSPPEPSTPTSTHLPAADRTDLGFRGHHPAGRRHPPPPAATATTCTPGAFHMGRMLQAGPKVFRLNLGFFGKGRQQPRSPRKSRFEPALHPQKLHERTWGTTARRHRRCLTVATSSIFRSASTPTPQRSGLC